MSFRLRTVWDRRELWSHHLPLKSYDQSPRKHILNLCSSKTSQTFWPMIEKLATGQDYVGKGLSTPKHLLMTTYCLYYLNYWNNISILTPLFLTQNDFENNKDITFSNSGWKKGMQRSFASNLVRAFTQISSCF